MAEKEKNPDLEEAIKEADERTAPHSMVETTFADAWTKMRLELQRDRDLYDACRENVAMVLYDYVHCTDAHARWRNEIADAILACIFGLKEES